MADFGKLTEAVVAGDSEKAVKLTREAMAEKIPAREILGKWLLPSMELIGEQFEKGDVFFPELLMAANTMKAAVALLKIPAPFSMILLKTPLLNGSFHL